ncbi:hypothetical protein NYJ85_01920 [Helicobacter sp. CPD2-1]|nr:hypothetical protein [Helicobacter sp. CPD2-1]
MRDKSMILRRGLAHYRLDKSLRPRLENIDFSPQILESCGRQCCRENGGQSVERSKNEKSGF